VFIVGPYLFTGEELAKYLDARLAEALAAAREGQDGGEGGADLVRAIYDRFHVPETELLSDNAYFTAERPLNDEECASIGVRDEDKAKYKRIGIVVPYSGDEHLLTYQPTIYSAHQPQAEVKDGALHMVWFLNEVEEYQLENNFKRQIALIDRTLEVTQWQAMGYNQQMMATLKAELMGEADASG
jgi:hypothetical protein